MRSVLDNFNHETNVQAFVECKNIDELRQILLECNSEFKSTRKTPLANECRRLLTQWKECLIE